MCTDSSNHRRPSVTRLPLLRYDLNHQRHAAISKGGFNDSGKLNHQFLPELPVSGLLHPLWPFGKVPGVVTNPREVDQSLQPLDHLRHGPHQPLLRPESLAPVLRRASGSRKGGEWKHEDYDVDGDRWRRLKTRTYRA